MQTEILFIRIAVILLAFSGHAIYERRLIGCLDTQCIKFSNLVSQISNYYHPRNVNGKCLLHVQNILMAPYYSRREVRHILFNFYNVSKNFFCRKHHLYVDLYAFINIIVLESLLRMKISCAVLDAIRLKIVAFRCKTIYLIQFIGYNLRFKCIYIFCESSS